jgi:hypothetical protein
MRISNAVIVAPGGIGTVLELMYTWQLIQVGHITARPIILIGTMWPGLLEWMKSEVLKKKLISNSDFDNILIVEHAEEAFDLLKPHVKKFYLDHKEQK